MAITVSGISSARVTRATGFETARIAQLREIAAKARAAGIGVCSSSLIQDQVFRTLSVTVVPAGQSDCVDPGPHSYIGLP
jgi:hypothetical protein